MKIQVPGVESNTTSVADLLLFAGQGGNFKFQATLIWEAHSRIRRWIIVERMAMSAPEAHSRSYDKAQTPRRAARNIEAGRRALPAFFPGSIYSRLCCLSQPLIIFSEGAQGGN